MWVTKVNFTCLKLLTAVAAEVAFLSGANAAALERYPIKVAFHVTYKGRSVDVSYLTTVRKEFQSLRYMTLGMFKYERGRSRMSLRMWAGSLILLQPA